MKVRLSGDARAYLRREAAYLRKYNQKAAKAFVDRMTEARKNLARFPEMGKTFDRLPIPGSHRLVVGDYLLDYDVTDDEVMILSIRHGQQQPLTPEIEDDFEYEEDAASHPTPSLNSLTLCAFGSTSGSETQRSKVWWRWLPNGVKLRVGTRR